MPELPAELWDAIATFSLQARRWKQTLRALMSTSSLFHAAVAAFVAKASAVFDCHLGQTQDVASPMLENALHAHNNMLSYRQFLECKLLRDVSMARIADALPMPLDFLEIAWQYDCCLMEYKNIASCEEEDDENDEETLQSIVSIPSHDNGIVVRYHNNVYNDAVKVTWTIQALDMHVGWFYERKLRRAWIDSGSYRILCLDFYKRVARLIINYPNNEERRRHFYILAFRDWLEQYEPSLEVLSDACVGIKNAIESIENATSLVCERYWINNMRAALFVNTSITSAIKCSSQCYAQLMEERRFLKAARERMSAIKPS